MVKRPSGLPNCQGGPATCAVLTATGDCVVESPDHLDESQISNSATSAAAKPQSQQGRQRLWRNARTCIGMEGRLGVMVLSGGYWGWSRVGDSMPRAWSIFSATLKAASNSLMPNCCMSW